MIQADGLTGAEIEACVKTAMFNAFYEDREYTINDIEDAIQKTVPLIAMKKEEINVLRQWAKGRAKKANDYSIRGISETNSKQGSRIVMHT